MKMHKVERNNPPKDLKKKSKDWIKSMSKSLDFDVDIEWEKFKSTKLGKETSENLKQMYANCCMYCEGTVGVTSYEQIEHFRPKSKYPELCFEYDNLHLACEICNNNKSNKYKDEYIDPTLVNPREYIYYRNWEAVGKNEIGTMMVELVKLNNDTRMRFRKAKLQIIQERLNVIVKYIENAKDNEDIKTLLLIDLNDIYKAMEHGSPYCTMITDNFKENVDMIYKLLS